MDAGLQKNLEDALAQAGVPRALWPVYFEKEEHRIARRRASNDEERNRIMRRISDRDAHERRRRERFAVFIMMLWWLLKLDERQPAPFLDFGHRALLSTEYARIDIDCAQRALLGVAWAKFGRTAALERALQVGVSNMTGSHTIPVKYAIRALERIDIEAMEKAKPEKELQQHEQNNDVQKNEEQQQQPQPIAITQEPAAITEPLDQPFDPELAAPNF